MLSKCCKSVFFFSRKISLRKYLKGNPFKNKVSLHMRTLKFLEAYACAYAEIQAFVEPCKSKTRTLIVIFHND